MKKSLLILSVLFACRVSQSYGQRSAQSQLNKILIDTIVTHFNKGDLKGIYALATSSFKTDVSEDQLVNLLSGGIALGKIVSSELITEDTVNGATYRLVFASKSLQLTIRAVSAVSYDNFGLSFYKLPIVRTREKFLSDNSLKTKLDSVVQRAVTTYMSNKNVAGLSVGVIQNGKIYSYNFGETKKGTGQLPTETTLYEIGSITKTFTGILLANAVLEGRMALNDDIRQYLDGAYPNLQFAGQPIRVVHLSNHTSRLPSQPSVVGSNNDPFSPSVKVDQKMINDILHHVTLDTLPGVKREYSNFAVGLLGNILEKVYKTSYEQLLKKFIFDPFGMRQSKITLSMSDHKAFAQGYDVEGKDASYWRNRLAEPAGGIRSTTQDMLLYMKAQIDSKNKAADLSHQLTFGDEKRGTGLNWGISTTKKGDLRWSHDGGTDGFTSLCLIYPGLNAGIILLTNNGDHGDTSFFDIATSIYAKALNNR